MTHFYSSFLAPIQFFIHDQYLIIVLESEYTVKISTICSENLHHQGNMKCLHPILAILRASVFILSGLEWAFLHYLLPCSALYCTVVHCFVSFCTAVNCTVMACNSFCDFYCCKLYRIVVQCSVSFCIAVNCTLLFYIVLYDFVLL